MTEQQTPVRVDVTDQVASGSAVRVRRAAPADQARLGQALAAAFADDPVFTWLIPPDAPNRDERARAFFTLMTRSYLRRGKPVYAGPDGVAAALWSAPGPWQLPMSEVAREIRGTLKAFGRTAVTALRAQLQVESRHPKEPLHWYLGYLGTEPGSQGRGIGAALLRAVLDDADASGTPAYLESSNERNLTLYERHGFRVVEELRLLGTGPTVYRMWREPAG